MRALVARRLRPPASAAAVTAPAPRGFTVVEVLVGMVLGLVATLALAGLLTAAGAARARAADRSEAAAAAATAVDQLARDVRLAGYDPRARGVAPISGATATTITLAADLDGDGTVDTASEEQIGYRTSGGDTLQRTVGRQTLPLVSELTADGFRLHYLDANGTEIDPRNATALATTRVVTFEVALRSTRFHGALTFAGGARLLNR